jgi:anti-anti-sigma regulatory factor
MEILQRNWRINAGVTVMISSRLHAISEEGSLTIRINGPMDLLLTAALRESCHDTGVTYHRYIVDFQDVSIVRDSGLALLLMLKRWANRAGAKLYVTNGNSELMRRCRTLGIRPA